jgi:hypothetical protein
VFKGRKVIIAVLGIFCFIRFAGAQNMENYFTFNAKRAIPFRPFTLQEFGIRNGDDMVNLPSTGKSMKASDYVKSINQVEEWLNRKGYTLRVSNYEKGKRYDLGLRGKLKDANTQYKPAKKNPEFRPFNDPFHNTLVDSPARVLKYYNELQANIPAWQSNTTGNGSASAGIHYNDNGTLFENFWGNAGSEIYCFALGYSSTYQTTYFRKQDAAGTLDCHINTASKVTGILFGRRIDIFTGSIQDLNYTNGKLGGKASLNGAQKAFRTAREADSLVDDRLHYGFTIPFSIGPVPMRVTCNLDGKVKYLWNLGMTNEGKLSACVLNVQTNLTCSGSCDATIGIAGAGLEGIINLIEKLGENDIIWVNSVGPDKVAGTYTTDGTYTVMSGKIGINVWIDLLFWSDSWFLEIYGWNGDSRTYSNAIQQVRPAYQ